MIRHQKGISPCAKFTSRFFYIPRVDWRLFYPYCILCFLLQNRIDCPQPFYITFSQHLWEGKRVERKAEGLPAFHRHRGILFVGLGDFRNEWIARHRREQKMQVTFTCKFVIYFLIVVYAFNLSHIIFNVSFFSAHYGAACVQFWIRFWVMTNYRNYYEFRSQVRVLLTAQIQL